MVISVIIGLFTTRLVLIALGEVDFGIYALVAGVVASLNFLNNAMSNSSIRFIAHSMGNKDPLVFKRTFNTTVFIHILVGIVAFVMIEAGGYLMFEYFLQIPAERMFAAKIVFHLMAITTFIVIVSVPYDALISAHEDFLALSLIEISAIFIKLGIALILLNYSNDRLILYGVLMMITQLMVRIVKQFFSYFRYVDTDISFKRYLHKPLIKQVLSFTGWNLFGSICAIGSTQVSALIINFFFGVRLNAAIGVARQANSQILSLTYNLTRATLPKIMKSEGSGDREKMLYLTMTSAKFSVFLFVFIAIPIFLETPFLLGLWLDSVPDFTIIFLRLFLIGAFIERFTFQLTDAIRSVGEIRNFQITESLVLLSSLPISYILFQFDFPPPTIYVVNALILLLVGALRLYFANILTGLLVKDYWDKVIYKAMIPIVVGIVIVSLFQSFLETGMIKFILVSFVHIVLISILIWKLGLDLKERNTIYTFVTKVIKIHHKNC